MVKLSGFQPIPEGSYTFKITAVNFKSDFGKMEVACITKDGTKHTERYSFMKKNKEQNDGAIMAFSILAKAAMDDPTLEEIDEQQLVGHFFSTDVEHDVQPSNTDSSKLMTWVRLKNLQPSVGWEGAPAAAAAPSVDLNSLLNM